MTLTRKQAIRNLRELVAHRPQDDQVIQQFCPEDWREYIYPEAVALQKQATSKKEVCFPPEIWELIKQFCICQGDKLAQKNYLFKQVLGRAFYNPLDGFDCLSTAKFVGDNALFVSVIQDGVKLEPFAGTLQTGMTIVIFETKELYKLSTTYTRFVVGEDEYDLYRVDEHRKMEYRGHLYYHIAEPDGGCLEHRRLTEVRGNPVTENIRVKRAVSKFHSLYKLIYLIDPSKSVVMRTLWIELNH